MKSWGHKTIKFSFDNSSSFFDDHQSC
uniref:Uncharacterized protein n=1 Tax=Arundo donax TaxID=35708 RepID=A0A0A8Z8A2_ARUDO